MRSLLLYVFVSLLLTCRNISAFAYQINNKNDKYDYAFTKLYSDLGSYARKLASFEPKTICNFFGYKVECAKITLSHQATEKLTHAMMKKSGLFSPSDIKNGWAVNEWDNIPFLSGASYILTKAIPYLPWLAYNTPGKHPFMAKAKDYEELAARYYKVDKTTSLRELSINPPAFSFFASHPDGERNNEWFEGMAKKDEVLFGSQIEAFWNCYRAYSKTLTPTECGRECMIVVEEVNGSRSSLAYCKIRTVQSVFGAPEDCLKVVLHDGQDTCILSAMNFVPPPGEGGNGSNDIVCSPDLKGMTVTSALENAGAKILVRISELHKKNTDLKLRRCK